MTYLTDLATACRKSGLRVVEVAGWQTRGHGGMTAARGVVCHWTATPDTTYPLESYPSMGIVTNGRSDLPGPLANLGLGRDGTVFVIAAGLAYHAGTGYWSGVGSNGNANMIGIEAEEGGDGDWTAAMLAAYPRLCAALRLHYRFAVGNVIGHHEWAPGRKVDIRTWPGGMAAFRQAASQAPEENTVSDWSYKNNAVPGVNDRDAYSLLVAAANPWSYKNLAVSTKDTFGLLADAARNPWAYKNTDVDSRDAFGLLTAAMRDAADTKAEVAELRGQVAQLTSLVAQLVNR